VDNLKVSFTYNIISQDKKKVKKKMATKIYPNADRNPDGTWKAPSIHKTQEKTNNTTTKHSKKRKK
jgi:hypothetical protein